MYLFDCTCKSLNRLGENRKTEIQDIQPSNLREAKTQKTDSGWKENLSRIAEAHPKSALAERYGKKTIKQSKTDQVLAKHRKRGK